MKLYYHPNCNSCKKAIRFLDERNTKYTLIDLREKAPSLKELKSMSQAYDEQWKKLFNTSGLVYREMKLKDKIKEFSSDEAFKLLNSNGLLVKRPFLISDKISLVAFKEETWNQSFS